MARYVSRKAVAGGAWTKEKVKKWIFKPIIWLWNRFKQFMNFLGRKIK